MDTDQTATTGENIVDLDQTAPTLFVYGSTLFVYEASKILMDNKKQTYAGLRSHNNLFILHQIIYRTCFTLFSRCNS